MSVQLCVNSEPQKQDTRIQEEKEQEKEEEQGEKEEEEEEQQQEEHEELCWAADWHLVSIIEHMWETVGAAWLPVSLLLGRGRMWWRRRSWFSGGAAGVHTPP